MAKLTVRDLRRRWKPHKLRLHEIRTDHPTTIRFHRCCSWLDQSQELFESKQYDQALINQWIAFNALYGQWDPDRNDPCGDRECWKRFCEVILDLDQSDVISETLHEHKRLVMTLLDDEYLSSFFWKEPTQKRARQSKKAMFDARTWYLEQRWLLILDRCMERIYLIRCQLVHGAATCGGKLNRTSLKRCVMMLDRLLPAMLNVFADHGADRDWGLLCYPPLNPARS